MAGKENITKNNVYRYMHANMRLRIRYGVEISADEYNELCQIMATGCGQGRREEGDVVEAWLEVKPNVWAAAVFRKSEGCIVTFMPSPPPISNVRQQISANQLNMLVQEEAKKHAKQKIKEALEQGYVEDLYAESGVIHEERKRYSNRDVNWMIGQIKESLDLAKYGYLSDALARIEAVSSIKLHERPTSHVATTEETLNADVQYLKPHWHKVVLKFFTKNGV